MLWCEGDEFQPSKLTTRINIAERLLKSGDYSDATISYYNVTFRIHRSILRSQSEYFRNAAITSTSTNVGTPINNNTNSSDYPSDINHPTSVARPIIKEHTDSEEESSYKCQLVRTEDGDLDECWLTVLCIALGSDTLFLASKIAA